MTTTDLLKRLQDPEDNFVERKSAGVSSSDIRKTVSAFANTVVDEDAILFVGVEDKTARIVGVVDPESIQRKIDAACTADCYPPIAYTTSVLKHDGKQVVAVVIPPSRNKPHFTGPAFVRVGSSSKKASSAQFEELVHSRLDKCREILRSKDEGLISVRMIDYQLGSHKPMGRPYSAHTECVIRECTSHLVKLEEPATGRTYSEPLSGVVIGYDDAKRRALLIIRFPPG